MKKPIREQSRNIILDSIADGVFTVDEDWRITSFNRAAEHITGVPREQAVGRPCRDIFHSSICESECALGKTMRTGRPIVDLAIDIQDATGRRIPISISTAILSDEDGNVMGGVETFRDLSVVEELRKELQDKYTVEDIVGRSPAMRRIFDILPQIAQSNSTILLEGESGTGKELFARAIHNLSDRRDKPFVIINCGALPDTLLESELFGYEAGAFTDARRKKLGRFSLAHGGTIFLDEIGDISAAMQMRLLRVVEEGTFEPLGVRENAHGGYASHSRHKQGPRKTRQQGCLPGGFLLPNPRSPRRAAGPARTPRRYPVARGLLPGQVQPAPKQEGHRRVGRGHGGADGLRLPR